jgi:hypothetical protein
MPPHPTDMVANFNPQITDGETEVQRAGTSSPNSISKLRIESNPPQTIFSHGLHGLARKPCVGSVHRGTNRGTEGLSKLPKRSVALGPISEPVPGHKDMQKNAHWLWSPAPSGLCLLQGARGST